MMSVNPEPLELFTDYFEVLVADTEALKKQVYNIRYEVYCEEFGYEPKEAFPDQLEFDEFDEYSTHCLVMHRQSGIAAGCVRLVNGSADQILPIEAHCAEAIDPAYLADLRANRETSCELSRLAVRKAFRRRHGESKTPMGERLDPELARNEARVFPLIAVAAYIAACAAAELTGRHRGYAMMEPYLPRLLRRSGIVFSSIGEPMDYHGTRAPYMTNASRVIDGMAPELQGMYRRICSSYQFQALQQGACQKRQA